MVDLSAILWAHSLLLISDVPKNGPGNVILFLLLGISPRKEDMEAILTGGDAGRSKVIQCAQNLIG